MLHGMICPTTTAKHRGNTMQRTGEYREAPQPLSHFLEGSWASLDLGTQNAWPAQCKKRHQTPFARFGIWFPPRVPSQVIVNCGDNMRTHPRSNEFTGYVKTCRKRMYIKFYKVMYQDFGEIAVEHVVGVVDLLRICQVRALCSALLQLTQPRDFSWWILRCHGTECLTRSHHPLLAATIQWSAELNFGL